MKQKNKLYCKICKYAVINGSHTVMGEILGSKLKTNYWNSSL